MDAQGTVGERQERAPDLPARVREAPQGKGLSSWAFDSYGHKWGGGQCGVKAGACASESAPPGSESLLCDLR